MTSTTMFENCNLSHQHYDILQLKHRVMYVDVDNYYKGYVSTLLYGISPALW